MLQLTLKRAPQTFFANNFSKILSWNLAAWSLKGKLNSLINMMETFFFSLCKIFHVHCHFQRLQQCLIGFSFMSLRSRRRKKFIFNAFPSQPVTNQITLILRGASLGFLTPPTAWGFAEIFMLHDNVAMDTTLLHIFMAWKLRRKLNVENPSRLRSDIPSLRKQKCLRFFLMPTFSHLLNIHGNINAFFQSS